MERGTKTACKEKSFEELLKKSPAAPTAGTVTLIGTLVQSSEPGKFALTLQDGSTVTLKTASVKGHTVLGKSAEQPIVRVEVDATPQGTGFPDQMGPWTLAENAQSPWGTRGAPVQTGGVVPFALATPHHAPPATLVALQGRGNAAFLTGWWDPKNPFWDNTAWANQYTWFGREKILPDHDATNPGSRFPD